MEIIAHKLSGTNLETIDSTSSYRNPDTIINYLLLIDGLLITIILVVGFFITRPKKKSLIMQSVLEDSQKIDKIINNTLFKLRIATHADRCVLGLFHDTNLYSDNHHMLKVSVFHESLREGTDSVKRRVKDIPLTYLAEEFQTYKENNNKFIFHLNNSALKEGCRLHLERIGVASIVNILLTYKEKAPIGILSFQFTEPQDFITFDVINMQLEGMYDHQLKFFTDKLISCIMTNG